MMQSSREPTVAAGGDPKDRSSYVFRGRTIGELVGGAPNCKVQWSASDKILVHGFLAYYRVTAETLKELKNAPSDEKTRIRTVEKYSNHQGANKYPKSADLHVLAIRMNIDLATLTDEEWRAIRTKMLSSLTYYLQKFKKEKPLPTVYDKKINKSVVEWPENIRNDMILGWYVARDPGGCSTSIAKHRPVDPPSSIAKSSVAGHLRSTMRAVPKLQHPRHNGQWEPSGWSSSSNASSDSSPATSPATSPDRCHFSYRDQKFLALTSAETNYRPAVHSTGGPVPDIQRLIDALHQQTDRLVGRLLEEINALLVSVQGRSRAESDRKRLYVEHVRKAREQARQDRMECVSRIKAQLEVLGLDDAEKGIWAWLYHDAFDEALMNFILYM
ncbi:uncharacterized protein CCOS01_08481 [Colletotrichum costaricense]|uniref:Uncharacterized protein n=1 Tax=Colletotrichum costaricense TaxID=1209916 RepID=A0AAI9YVY9_9PEZI|nr:uncharacterized protein CCOS01_08481 [Colletotrichum costaricense]KAK1526063.1 hypothetical protein CCOS01_08481 [Colletotrichum costaricense]